MNATATRDRFWFAVIGIMSAVAIAAVAFVLTGPRLASGLDVSALPALNTAWNAAAAVLLVAALIAIRRRAVPVHRALVLSAFAASALFLAGYLLYHSFSEGPDRYGGPVPWLYYAILISHIILAVTIVPLALVTLAPRLDLPSSASRRGPGHVPDLAVRLCDRGGDLRLPVLARRIGETVADIPTGCGLTAAGGRRGARCR